ncbi:MAG: gephyrin-like molybdotransferase Glp [Halovenus sp.]|uniref:molybdopterin molybdotransferase MoeA n=1 Tax=Halovenus amylolytica TaxID=2500550 RepID=UPI000FE399CD
MSDQDHSHEPFRDRTPLAEARTELHERIEPHDRTETVSLESAIGRVVATHIESPANVPSYRRAAMDGYAVRAEDTFGASDRSPVVLRESDDELAPRQTRQVHTGSQVPEAADAVVMVEETEAVGSEIEIFDSVSEGENVAPVGEDVTAGQKLYEPGAQLRPSDLGLLKSVGIGEVTVYEQPTVSVIPTGEELVQSDPGPGEIIETNGLTVSTLAETWGGDPTYNEIVTDDESALADAITDGLSHDIVVTTGGSSVGARDLVPDVVAELGEVIVHGVGLKPGHPVAIGVVEETPVLMLPGYPVSCLVNAVQFLRPAIAWANGRAIEPFPTVTARLDEKIYSEPGIRSFARVQLDEEDGEQVASSVRASGAGVLSSVALSDGWVVVPEEREGLDAGTTVDVQLWEGGA